MAYKERFRKLTSVLITLILILSLTSVARAANLLKNPSFEEQIPGEFPPGWIPFGSVTKLDENIIFTKGDAPGGEWFLTITDDSPTMGYGLKSQPVPAEPGKTYIAKTQAKVDTGNLTLYLEFLDTNGRRIHNVTVYKHSSKNQEWSQISVSAQAPPGTVEAAVILYAQGSNVGIGHMDDISLEELTPEK
jgi:hypothetical protein